MDRLLHNDPSAVDEIPRDWDQTDPALQRRIVAGLAELVCELEAKMEVYVSGHSPCPACGNRWARLILWPGSAPLLDCQACRSHFPVRLQVAMPPTYPGGESEWRDMPWVAEEQP